MPSTSYLQMHGRVGNDKVPREKGVFMTRLHSSPHASKQPGKPKEEARKTPRKQPTTGISNRPSKEEQDRQEEVPPHGQAKK